MGLVAAQNFEIGKYRDKSKSHPPIPKVEFSLYGEELPYSANRTGLVQVEFIVDEKGKVCDAIVLDTFNTTFNEVILDKVKQTSYYPAMQNGRPVRVRYKLPIKIKN
tara:strand:- start:6908 stop:7228 length:321 start_codon:yes stop_codon:yes gene_type:complete